MITGRATGTGWSLMRSAQRSVSGIKHITSSISSSIRDQNSFSVSLAESVSGTHLNLVFSVMQKLKVEKLKMILALCIVSTGYICEPRLKGAWRRSVSGTAWESCSGEKHCFFTIITMITPLLPPSWPSQWSQLPPSWPSQWSWPVANCWGLNDLLVGAPDL